MTEKKLNLYTSLFFFFVFIPVLTLLVPTVKWAETRPILLFSTIGYLILCYIVLTRYNIPGLFIRHHYVRGSILSVLALGVTAVFTHVADWLNMYELPGQTPRTTHIYSTIWFLFLVILGYSFFNNMLQEASRLARQREEMEAQRDKAELAMYKAQINPHFLFNTLNTLYGLILTDSDKREEAFEKFINMMKYTYSNANRDYISLQEEMDYLQQYIDLQLLRLGDVTRVDAKFEVDDPHTSIAPMLLITLIENAFKYGISSTEYSAIHIHLTVRRHMLSFMVHNTRINKTVKVSSGHGLSNLKHRLDLLYPDDYTLRRRQDKDGFMMKLTIKLQN